MRDELGYPHYIRPNHVTRLPRRHVCLDTEANQAEDRGVKTQTFRLAVASYDHQERKGVPWAKTQWGRFTNPQELWDWIDARTIKGRRLVVVAHNLGYDLRISQALEILPAMGWVLDVLKLDDGKAWCRWHRDGRGLVMVDSMSWYQKSLADLGALIGEAKPDLPEWDESDDAWFARCEADVRILRECWTRTLAWIQSADMGTWKPTGAGQGWAAWRHRFMSHKVLHHGIAAAAVAERAAAYAGRCEAWRWGDLGPGPWEEWDLQSCYAQVAYDHDLPTRLAGHGGPRQAAGWVVKPGRFLHLFRGTITTDVPVLPQRTKIGIRWPVGTFEGWWWDHEIRFAIESGASFEAAEAWRYESSPLLVDWATWCLDAIDPETSDLDPLIRLVVKGWSRSLIGKFGSRWSEWQEYGEAAPGGIRLAHMASPNGDGSRRLLSVGEKSMIEGDMIDSPDGAVHVMSYVMAVARMRLWRCMLTAGLDQVVYVDTDGLIVTPDGASKLQAASLPGLRMKSRWRHVEVYGPRSIVTDGRLRASGVSSKATRVGQRRWDGEVWRSLPTSLVRHELGSVVIAPRSWTLSGVDHRRAHLTNGATGAIRVDGTAI